MGVQYYKDPASAHQAFMCFQYAAQEGHILAQYHLGVCYFFGCGVAQNYNDAFLWYKKAVDQGYIPAITNIQEILISIEKNSYKTLNSTLYIFGAEGLELK